MRLDELLSAWTNVSIPVCLINQLQNDSRMIKPGDLFLAYPGALSDGRLYIQQAMNAGAAAIAYDPQGMPCALPHAIPCIAVPHLGTLLGFIAQKFYNNPGQSLKITGVTGTNGKTTIAYQLAQAHALLGQHAAYIGTIGQGDVHHLKPLTNTTPDGLCLQKLLAQFKLQEMHHVCMEVSSHALSQHRMDGIELQQALFTNLTLDHLDYHHSMQEYGAAKALLFARPELQYAIINQDDAYHQMMQDALLPHVKQLTYGLQKGCDVQATAWHMSMQGTDIEVRSIWGIHQLKIQALGQFNIYNSLAVFSSLLAFGYKPSIIEAVMGQLKAAPGRMEIVATEPYVLVDYAHTPDALENVLKTLIQLKKGRLWVVFGCGGDRDRTKRPIMGKVACQYAEEIIITSDNPRNEAPQAIIDEIAAGVVAASHAKKLINRKEAIVYALTHAEKDDIILIAGKGHEAYQQIGAVKHHFSDQEVVRQFLSSK
jgi:UDP-N-acetylmuramoyl-L-alanyl-D-glutamate--2,6-diaminopimelate ligase